MTDDPLGDDPNETLRELHELAVTDPEEVYQIVSSVDSISSFDDEPALNIIGLHSSLAKSRTT